MIVFDIETRPEKIDKIKKLIEPFSFRDPPGEFDESKVKYGRAKAEEKRRAILEERRAAHEKSVEDYEEDKKRAEEAYIEKALERAALSPLTGQVCAIGLLTPKGPWIGTDIEHDEKTLLEWFWSAYHKNVLEDPSEAEFWVGHCIKTFDLPFLINRSRLHGLEIPNIIERNRYWSPVFIDTNELWGCGQYQSYIKLQTLADFFGVEGKSEDGGQDFWKWLDNDELSRAEDYLFSDLRAAKEVAEAMGVV